MNLIDELNINIFRLIQEKSNEYEKIIFTINDGELKGIENKQIEIKFIKSKDVVYEIDLIGTKINQLITNIYNKQIKSIDINFSSCSTKTQQLDFFPSFIKDIKMCFKFNCDIFDNLPEDLERLEIQDIPNALEITKELNNLPNKLKVLIMVNVWYNLGLDNLPSSLEVLELGFKNLYLNKFDNLPSNLKYLKINFINRKKNKIPELNNLPDSLEYIELENYNGFIINKYPKNLKKIKYRTEEEKELTNVPENIIVIRELINKFKFGF